MDYKCKDGMMDNRMVKDTHQEGIHRVLQRKPNPMDSAGHNGKMGQNHTKSGFGRKGESMTPKSA